MTTWPVPIGFKTRYADAVTGATPLSILNENYDKVPIDGLLNDACSELPDHAHGFLGKYGRIPW